MPSLTYEQNGTLHAGRITGRVLIGRRLSHGVIIVDPAVSRLHAWIARDEDGYPMLTDAGSRSGTFVNGQLIIRHELQDGDQIEVGPTILTYHEDDELPEDAEPVTLTSASATVESSHAGILFNCQCGAPLWVGAELAGKRGLCRYCGEAVQVPKPSRGSRKSQSKASKPKPPAAKPPAAKPVVAVPASPPTPVEPTPVIAPLASSALKVAAIELATPVPPADEPARIDTPEPLVAAEALVAPASTSESTGDTTADEPVVSPESLAPESAPAEPPVFELPAAEPPAAEPAVLDDIFDEPVSTSTTAEPAEIGAVHTEADPLLDEPATTATAAPPSAEPFAAVETSELEAGSDFQAATTPEPPLEKAVEDASLDEPLLEAPVEEPWAIADDAPPTLEDSDVPVTPTHVDALTPVDELLPSPEIATTIAAPPPVPPIAPRSALTPRFVPLSVPDESDLLSEDETFAPRPAARTAPVAPPPPSVPHATPPAPQPAAFRSSPDLLEAHDVQPAGLFADVAGLSESRVDEVVALPPDLTPPPRTVSGARATACGVCHTGIDPDEPLTTCPDCRTTFHADCWLENYGCSTYGCRQVNAIKPASVKEAEQRETAAFSASAADTPKPPFPVEPVLLAFSVIGSVVGALLFGTLALAVTLAALMALATRPLRRPGLLVLAILIGILGTFGGAALSDFWWFNGRHLVLLHR